VADQVKNTRSDPRVAVDAFVKVAGADHEYVFRTRDLSRSGLFLYTRVGHIYPFKVGSTLQLELYDYDQFVTCRAVVVRIVEAGSNESEKYPTGFGLRIIEIDTENKQRLTQLLDSIAKDGGVY